MSDLMDFAEALIRALQKPEAQFALEKWRYQMAEYGLKAIQFAESCETKDYSILWEEWTADKAEFDRLVAEHHAAIK